ncbi:MAG: ribosome biogenesis GTP-binding protein YihA/YsxC, partial [Rickettsiales bacterium]
MAEAASGAGAEFARKLFAGQCQFMWGAATIEQLPPMGLPEVAFVGRSNVGKSSLINALTGQKALARTSHTPGRTQQLNFFDLGGKLMLVDLPGYGYAKVSKTQVANWTALMKRYLAGRQVLHRVCLLVDSRHGLKPSDLEMMDMLDIAAVTYQIVLTKMDKLKPGQRKARIEEVQKALATRPAAHPEVMATSSVAKEGMDALRQALSAFVKEE